MPRDNAFAALLGVTYVLEDIASDAQRAAGGLTRTQLRCLHTVSEDDGLRLGDLAERLGVNPSTAMRTIDRLIAAKYVRRRENPDDRREVQLTLTKQGADAVEASVASRRASLDEILRRMPSGARNTMVDALHHFLAAAGSAPAHVPAAPSDNTPGVGTG